MPQNPRRDALSRKVEADVEAKADFNALKNQWDAIEKDFATYATKQVRGLLVVVVTDWLGVAVRE